MSFIYEDPIDAKIYNTINKSKSEIKVEICSQKDVLRMQFENTILEFVGNKAVELKKFN